MALQFRPPEDLVNAYLQRPSSGQIASEGVNKAFETYVKQKQQEQTTDLAQQSKDVEMAKGIADNGQDFTNALAQVKAQRPAPAPTMMDRLNSWIAGGKKSNPVATAQPAQGNVPPQQSTGTVAGMEPMAQQQPQGQPIDENFITPTGELDQNAISTYKTQHGRKGLENLDKQLSLSDKLQTAHDRRQPQPVYDKSGHKRFTVEPNARIEEPSTRGDEANQKHEDRMAKAVTDFGKQIENHPVIKKLMDQDVGLGQVEEMSHLVNGGNSVASSAMGTKMARAMGEVGVLTETDIKRYVQSGKLAQGAADTLSKWIAGTPTQATMQEIGQISSVLRDSFHGKIQPIYDRHINRFARAYKIDPEEAAHLLDLPYSGGAGNKVPTISSQEDYNKLASGSEYLSADGALHRKK